MRYPPSQRKSTHARVLGSASREFRRKGYDGTGIQAVMKDTGMTAGGFYAHFSSKQALFTESIEEAFRNFRSRWSDGIPRKRDGGPAAELVRRYLSGSHRDGGAEGCPLPALAADVARSPEPTREAFEKGFQQLAGELEARLQGGREEVRNRAIAILALCAGGVLLSRAVADEALAAKILDASRAFAISAKSA